MRPDTDVIIVGAGISGLSAAKELERLGLRYILVEGSHRIGGRAYSEEIAPGVWFDLGCSYLHQAEVNPFVAMAEPLGVEIGREHGDLFDPGNMFVTCNGERLNSSETARYWTFFEDCTRRINEAAAAGKDYAVSDLIDLEHEFVAPYLHHMASLMTLDVDQVSSADYANTSDGQDVPIVRGYGNLVRRWAEGIEATLNSRVNSIHLKGNGVVVESLKGTIHGRAALVTVSTGVLGAGDIDFHPRLPDWKLDAINGLPCGTENKICLHFDTDVFGPDARGFHYCWNDNGDTGTFEANVMGLNTAIVFLGGRQAVWLEKQGQQASHEYAIEQVASVFGNNIRSHVTRSIVTAWTTEPWTWGSYSCALPGQFHQRAELARPIDERLFFAGEATMHKHQATGHGAMLSGVRAASEIAASLESGF